MLTKSDFDYDRWGNRLGDIKMDGCAWDKNNCINTLQDLWLRESVTIRREEGMSQKQRVPGGFTAVHTPQGNQQASATFGLILLRQILCFGCQNLWGCCSPAPLERWGPLHVFPLALWLCHLECAKHSVSSLSFLKWELPAWQSQTPWN